MTALKSWRTLLLAAALTLFCAPARAATSETYTLVKGLDQFDGSSVAWHLLEKNGFVVADPSYKQIFEPYLDDSMPVYITPDSVWHTFDVLRQQGIQQLESVQARKLADFSRRLWTSASAQATNNKDFADLAAFAAVGLALQDETFLASLTNDQRTLANTLLSGTGEVKPDIGFPIAADIFKRKLKSGATRTLSRYETARLWYATVDFRVSDARETRLALCLAWLVNKDPELLQFWHDLSDPWDALIGPPEDGSPLVYWEEAGKLPGATASIAELRKNVPALQARLAKLLPEPPSNDQCLTEDAAAHEAGRMKGFRLLPPRLWQGDACFQATTAPRVPGRPFPSGLDVLTASPQLRSPAAERALRAIGGDAAAEAALKADTAPAPDTLPAETLSVLATLQQPLPEQMPPAFRSGAWPQAQLWAQLGAWAEERHAGPWHTKVSVNEMDMPDNITGVVAPYPDFFAGLSKLSKETAAVLDKAGLDQPFEAKTAARILLQGILWQEGLGGGNEEDNARTTAELQQFELFYCQYEAPRQAELENNPPAAQKEVNDLEGLARRCSNQTAPAEADRKILMSVYEQRQVAPRLLRQLATFCDRLAELARKCRDGAALTVDDQKWICGYGVALARFQCYRSSAQEPPSDDFSIIDRVRPNAAASAALYAGVGRPEAFYIILPSEGRLQLYRGAVLTYREFVRSNAEPLDDESWRALARTGVAPAPPAFTEEFHAEREAAELIKIFASLSPNNEGYKAMSQTMEELQTRVTDHDVPQLITALGSLHGGLAEQIADGLTATIAKLNWQPSQKDLLAFLDQTNGDQAKYSSTILLGRPDWVDADYLCTNFDHAIPRARRVYCALLAHKKPTPAIRAVLLRALSDSSPAVRLEAAGDVDAVSRDEPRSQSPSSFNLFPAGDADAASHKEQNIDAALQERLNDDNDFVVAAAASALGRLDATNAAPALLAKLEQRLQGSEPTREDLAKQSEASHDFPLPTGGDSSSSRFYRPLRQRFNFGFQRFFGGVNVGNRMAGRTDEPPAASALIEALGKLHYAPAEGRIFSLLDGTHSAAAGRALKLLAPEKLEKRLVAEACDKKSDPQVRDRALQMLGSSPVTGSASDLVPLLDDTTVVPGQRVMAGREWRICDRAASTISVMMGRSVNLMPAQTTEQRDQLIEQVRQSVKASF